MEDSQLTAALLADDIGLGKTVITIGFMVLSSRTGSQQPMLTIVNIHAA